MDMDRSLMLAETGPAEPKRRWIAPIVQELGAMRQLTLLQGITIPGGCDPDMPETCGFD
jgi:hypothetical protein